MGRQDVDDAVAVLGEEAGVGEAVVAGELEAHQRALGAERGIQVVQLAQAPLEAVAAHIDPDRLALAAVRAAGHEDVKGLARIHADVDREGVRKQTLLGRSHRAAPGLGWNGGSDYLLFGWVKRV